MWADGLADVCNITLNFVARGNVVRRRSAFYAEKRVYSEPLGRRERPSRRGGGGARRSRSGMPGRIAGRGVPPAPHARSRGWTAVSRHSPVPVPRKGRTKRATRKAESARVGSRGGVRSARGPATAKHRLSWRHVDVRIMDSPLAPSARALRQEAQSPDSLPPEPGRLDALGGAAPSYAIVPLPAAGHPPAESRDEAQL